MDKKEVWDTVNLPEIKKFDSTELPDYYIVMDKNITFQQLVSMFKDSYIRYDHDNLNEGIKVTASDGKLKVKFALIGDDLSAPGRFQNFIDKAELKQLQKDYGKDKTANILYHRVLDYIEQIKEDYDLIIENYTVNYDY